MRRFIIPILLTIASFGLTKNASADNFSPGLHKNLPAVEPGFNYDLYLPKSYTPKSSLPIIILFPSRPNDTGEWVKKRMETWAEAHQAAVFINPNKTPKIAGPPQTDNNRYFQNIIKTLEKIPGLDPVARVAFAPESHAAVHALAAQMSVAFPGSIAGAICNYNMADLSPSYRAPDYLALVELHPTRSAWARSHPGPTDVFWFYVVDRYLSPAMHAQWDPLLRRHDGPFTMFDESGEEKVDPDVVDDSLEYLMDSIMLTHPRIAASRRKDALAEITARLDAAKSDADPLHKYRMTDVISRLPGLKLPFRTQAIAAWRAAAVDAIAAQPDDLSRFDLVTSLLADPRMKLAPELKPLKAKLAELQADRQCKTEVAAHAAAQEVFWQEWAGMHGAIQRQMGGALKPGTPIIPNIKWLEDPELMQKLSEVIKRYPNTFGAMEAQHRLEFLANRDAAPGQKKKK